MYNGVGIATPRGSGSSGHVQGNAFKLRSGRGAGGRGGGAPAESFRGRPGAPLSREPNREILEHNRRREVEVKLFEYRDQLEEQGGLTDAEIDAKVQERRKELLERGVPGAGPRERGKGHDATAEKERKMSAVRGALSVRDDYEEGEAFDEEKVKIRREQERAERKRAWEERQSERQRQQAERERRRDADRVGSGGAGGGRDAYPYPSRYGDRGRAGSPAPRSGARAPPRGRSPGSRLGEPAGFRDRDRSRSRSRSRGRGRQLRRRSRSADERSLSGSPSSGQRDRSRSRSGSGGRYRSPSSSRSPSRSSSPRSRSRSGGRYRKRRRDSPSRSPSRRSRSRSADRRSRSRSPR